MSDTTTITEEPTAFVRYFRKASPKNGQQYDMHEASVSIPIPMPNGPTDEAFLASVDQGLLDAKVSVWTALGIEFTVSEDGSLLEKPQAQAAPRAASGGGGGNVTQLRPAPAGVPDGDRQPDQSCGICGGATFNNTAPGAKKKPTSPDYKCKNRECGAAMWLSGRSAGEWKS